MKRYVDSSVLVAALVEDEPRHEACIALLGSEPLLLWTHGLAEVFSTLSGSRLGLRVPAALAVELIEDSLLPSLQLVQLTPKETLAALREAETRGVRGAAVYDLLHLWAARKAGATQLLTLSQRHFAALSRSGDPAIGVPT